MSRLIILRFQLVKGIKTPSPQTMKLIAEKLGELGTKKMLADREAEQSQYEEDLRRDGLWNKMTSDEKKFIRTPTDSVSAQMLKDVMWMNESAECLLWALGFVEAIPPYDTESNLDDLKLLMTRSIRQHLAEATLRDQKTIDHARDNAELWHWRCRTRLLQERGVHIPLPEGITLEEVIKLSAEFGAKDGRFAAPIENDFPAFGRPFRDISADEFAQATSIAMERHKALNWLCGYAPGNRWDKVPLDT